MKLGIFSVMDLHAYLHTHDLHIHTNSKVLLQEVRGREQHITDMDVDSQSLLAHMLA